MSHKHKKDEPLAGNQGRAGNGALHATHFTYNYTLDSETCQVLDEVLAKYRQHRAAYITTGDVAHFRAALVLAQDRETLLTHLNNRIEEASHDRLCHY